MPISDPFVLEANASRPRPRPATKTRSRAPRSDPFVALANASPRVVTAPKRAPARVSAPAPRVAAAAPSYSGGGGGSTAALISAVQNMAGGGAMAAFGGGGGKSDAQLLKAAQQAVGLELDPQIAAAKFAREQSSRNYNAIVAELKKRLGLTTTETTQLFGNLDVLLRDNQNKQAAQWETARGGATSAYDKLSQMVGQTYAGAQSSADTEAARLGQTNTAADSRLASDQAFTTGQVGAQQAAATSTIDAIKAAGTAEGAQLRGAAAATAPMMIGQARRAADDQQATALREHQARAGTLEFQLKQLSGSRAAKVQQTYAAMQEAQQQALQDQQQLAFMNSIRAAELGISQGQLDLAQRKAASDAQNSQANLVLRAKELQAKLNPPAKPGTGMERAYSYLGTGYKGRVPQSQLQAALEDAINGNSNDAGWDPTRLGQPGQMPGYDPKYIDQYKRDIQMAVRQRGWTSAEQQALMNAVNYYFGK